MSPIFAISWRGPAKKMSPCTVPTTDDNSLWTLQRDIMQMVRLLLTSFFLNYLPRCCSWASSEQRLAQLPNMRCPELGKQNPATRQRSVSLFNVGTRTLAERHSRPTVLRVRITTWTKSCVSEKYSCLSPQRPRNSWATHQADDRRTLSDPLLAVTHLVRMTRSFGLWDNFVDSHLVYEVVVLQLGKMSDATLVLTNTLPDGFSSADHHCHFGQQIEDRENTIHST